MQIPHTEKFCTHRKMLLSPYSAIHFSVYIECFSKFVKLLDTLPQNFRQTCSIIYVMCYIPRFGWRHRDTDSFAARLYKPRTTILTTDITSCQSLVVLPLYVWRHHFHSQYIHYCHCLPKIYNYALNNMYFKLFISDQFFSNVNKVGFDSFCCGFILL